MTYLQAINVVESKELRDIFLMLRQELKESDIPHRTTIRKRVEEVLSERLAQLGRDMEVHKLSLQTVRY